MRIWFKLNSSHHKKSLVRKINKWIVVRVFINRDVPKKHN